MTLSIVGPLSALLIVGNVKQALLDILLQPDPSSMVQVLWLYFKVRSVLPCVLQLLVSTQRLSHIECIFASFSSRGVVAVVVDHLPEDTVAISA